MKKTMIFGILALVFLGSLLSAQAVTDIAVNPTSRTPPGLIEARYYEGEAVVQYINGNSLIGMKGTAYVWVERDVLRNLFRGRYAICSKERGMCEAITTTGWMEGKVLQYWDKEVWVIKQGNSVGLLGPKEGFVRLDDGRRIITMNLKLKQPVSIPEPLPPLAVPE